MLSRQEHGHVVLANSSNITWASECLAETKNKTLPYTDYCIPSYYMSIFYTAILVGFVLIPQETAHHKHKSPLCRQNPHSNPKALHHASGRLGRLGRVGCLGRLGPRVQAGLHAKKMKFIHPLIHQELDFSKDRKPFQLCRLLDVFLNDWRCDCIRTHVHLCVCVYIHIYIYIGYYSPFPRDPDLAVISPLH